MMKSLHNLHVSKRSLGIYALLAILIGSFFGGGMWNILTLNLSNLNSQQFASLRALQKFTSEKQLVEFLETKPQGGMYWSLPSMPSPMPGGLKSFTNIEMDSAAESGQSSPDYSGTNVQVEGVDEADLVKTDGSYIYLVKGEKVFIVKAFPVEDAGVISVLELKFPASDLYINDGKLVVIQALTPYYSWYRWEESHPWIDMLNTTILVYDVSDKAAPTLERTVELDGYYTSSRMIGDYVYAITTEPAILNNTEPILPKFSSNDYISEAKPKDIWYNNQTDYYHDYTNIVAINVQDPKEWITHETYLLSSSHTLYVSQENIYLTSPWWLQYGEEGFESTMIYKIKVKEGEIQYDAEGSVPGRLLNQFSLDEYDNHLRVATTEGYLTRSGSKTSNNVYILNSSLGISGSIEDLAPGEDIYSARFMGVRGYLVTFKKVDPLFVIDLSNTKKPTVLGKLKIPGYSDYLHPYDENTLIGVGKETVEAEEGDFAWYQGVKISLFDVSDVSNPRELAKYEIGDRGTDSPALRNHKAFLFSEPRNLLVFPVLVAEINPDIYSGEVPPNAYGEYVYQGAFVFNVSRENGIILRGTITHIEDPQEFLKSGYWFESSSMIERSLFIENVLYTISQDIIKMNSLEDLSEIGLIQIQ